MMLSVGYLMVSTIDFFSIKQFKLSGFRLKGRLMLGLVIALTWYNFTMGFLVIAAGYVLSGPYGRIRSTLPAWLGGGVVTKPDRAKVVNIS
jgi:phosphatidylserine synthase